MFECEKYQSSDFDQKEKVKTIIIFTTGGWKYFDIILKRSIFSCKMTCEKIWKAVKVA